VTRVAALVGLAVAGAAALVYDRARRIAEEDDRPLSEVLSEMPGRLAADLQTMVDDLREAAEEGVDAAHRREEELDDQMRAARNGG
jgi:hypothetical protein